LIADLREENARLKKLLAEGKIDPTTLALIKDDSNDKAAGIHRKHVQRVN
jgi:hypothetical protein